MPRLAARMLILLGLMSILMAPAAASAGTSFHLIFINNTSTKITIGPLMRRNDWYANPLPGTVLATNDTTVVDTEMCSNFIACPGLSYVEFPLLTGDPNTPTAATFYLKGVRGGFPGWATNMQQDFGGAGGISVAHSRDPTLSVVIYDFNCSPTVANNVITCTITFGQALFSTTNKKYGSTDPEINARSYFQGGVLKTDAVVFNTVAMAGNLVALSTTGGLIYASPSAAGLALKTPTCPGAQVPSILYVIDASYNMYALPVCDDRSVAILPVIYSGAGSTGVIQPIDINRAFAQNLVNGQIPVTHGGLAGLRDVRAAGEVTIVNGAVQAINNNSGHYGVARQAFLDVMWWFSLRGYQGAFKSTTCDQPTGVCTLTAH